MHTHTCIHTYIYVYMSKHIHSLYKYTHLHYILYIFSLHYIYVYTHTYTHTHTHTYMQFIQYRSCRNTFNAHLLLVYSVLDTFHYFKHNTNINSCVPQNNPMRKLFLFYSWGEGGTGRWNWLYNEVQIINYGVRIWTQGMKDQSHVLNPWALLPHGQCLPFPTTHLDGASHDSLYRLDHLGFRDL